MPTYLDILYRKDPSRKDHEHGAWRFYTESLSWPEYVLYICTMRAYAYIFTDTYVYIRITQVDVYTYTYVHMRICV